jgi:hypothetical protein
MKVFGDVSQEAKVEVRSSVADVLDASKTRYAQFWSDARARGWRDGCCSKRRERKGTRACSVTYHHGRRIEYREYSVSSAPHGWRAV